MDCVVCDFLFFENHTSSIFFCLNFFYFQLLVIQNHFACPFNLLLQGIGRSWILKHEFYWGNLNVTYFLSSGGGVSGIADKNLVTSLSAIVTPRRIRMGCRCVTKYWV